MLSFKQFVAEGEGKHGEYPADQSEKTMINRIIQLLMNNVRTDANYDIAYSFLESPFGGQLWDKYYELFHTKHPDFEGPLDKPRFTRFKTEAKALFTKFKNGATFKGKEVTEDVFVKDDELLAAVNTQTTPRSSELNRINTNRRPLGSQGSLTRGVPVYYAFSYKPNPEPGGSTEILSSFKGKGPFKFPDARRDKFINDATEHMASEFKKMRIMPDVVVTPQSSSEVTSIFAAALADKLGVHSRKIGAFKKSASPDVSGDRETTRAEVMKRYIDMEYFNEKFTGDDEAKRVALRDLTSTIIRHIRDYGHVVSKKLRKETAKFVKGSMQSNLEGDDEYSLLEKDVMVIDDVLSSGSTMNDLFRVAKNELGAKSVFGVTLFARTSA